MAAGCTSAEVGRQGVVCGRAEEGEDGEESEEGEEPDGDEAAVGRAG
ncbi:hypothetical protein ACQ4WX_45180 [Streptomyces lasalocidi]